MYGDAFEREADRVVALYPYPRQAIMPLLHLVQRQEGYVTFDAGSWIAGRLGIVGLKSHDQSRNDEKFRKSAHRPIPLPASGVRPACP